MNPSRETKFSGTHGDRGILIFPVQLTTSRIDNLTRLMHTLLNVMTIIHTYIRTYCRDSAGTGPNNLKVVPNGCCLGRSPRTNEYAPLFPAPTIYRYEVGISKYRRYIDYSISIIISSN